MRQESRLGHKIQEGNFGYLEWCATFTFFEVESKLFRLPLTGGRLVDGQWRLLQTKKRTSRNSFSSSLFFSSESSNRFSRRYALFGLHNFCVFLSSKKNYFSGRWSIHPQILMLSQQLFSPPNQKGETDNNFIRYVELMFRNFQLIMICV